MDGAGAPIARCGPPDGSATDAVAEGAGRDAGGSTSAPTTCAEAQEKVGCCVGTVLYYCKSGLQSKACTGSDVCGWDESAGYYDCVNSPGGADPNGTYPLECK
jgi:hypothetical protein